MNAINANDLKTRGIAAIEVQLEEKQEAIIPVRGKNRYVVMQLEHYYYLRERELTAALAETRADQAAGRYEQASPEAHLARLDALK